MKQTQDLHRPNLDVVPWQVTHHNIEVTIINIFEGKTNMPEFQKKNVFRYCCFMCWKIFKKYYPQTKQGLGPTKTNYMKGLGKYTLECGFQYLNSL